jgi:hypothetical protein
VAQNIVCQMKLQAIVLLQTMIPINGRLGRNSTNSTSSTINVTGGVIEGRIQLKDLILAFLRVVYKKNLYRPRSDF